jgi:hypothetical protein
MLRSKTKTSGPRVGDIAFRWSNDGSRVVRGEIVGRTPDMPGRWDVEVDGKVERWSELTMLKCYGDRAAADMLTVGLAAIELTVRIARDRRCLKDEDDDGSILRERAIAALIG